jgi:rubrerythrin
MDIDKEKNNKTVLSHVGTIAQGYYCKKCGKFVSSRVANARCKHCEAVDES